MQAVTTIENAGPEAIADWLAQRLAGGGAITIPGGSTPFPILAALIQQHGAELDWASLEVWPNDDRIVPEDHEASNTGKIRALLKPAGAQIAALSEGTRPPHFALTWLGMGPDGHIASLFPNTDPQGGDPQMIRRLTPDPLPAHAPFDRITLTIPALLDTDRIVFTLGGAADKRAVFEAAMRGEHDLPIARLLRVAVERDIPVTVFT
ncbi:6-phosphogluconolactonase [Erythrobacter sp. NFXS35]|uniref:6-phosphogluconolactonase n=1 Tax=Erythrobacter sp. NFXS35 TaxID=2818436 RepID=UPI0032DFE792